MEYNISEKFLNEILSKSSRGLVGTLMKRFEVIKDREALKASVKELIYENHRTLRELIISFNSGVKFISQPKA